jgi:hypothetical protein
VRALRITTFLLSLLVIAAMAIVAVQVGSRWHLYGETERAIFGATAAVWAVSLVALGWAGRAGRPAAYVAVLVLLGLTLVGEIASWVAFSVT